MDAGDLGDISTFFTTDGKDVWKLVSCCMTPSCTLENLQTGAKETFGMGGLTAGTFHRIKMPMENTAPCSVPSLLG